MDWRSRFISIFENSWRPSFPLNCYSVPRNSASFVCVLVARNQSWAEMNSKFGKCFCFMLDLLGRNIVLKNWYHWDRLLRKVDNKWATARCKINDSAYLNGWVCLWTCWNAIYCELIASHFMATTSRLHRVALKWFELELNMLEFLEDATWGFVITLNCLTVDHVVTKRGRKSMRNCFIDGHLQGSLGHS